MRKLESVYRRIDDEEEAIDDSPYGIVGLIVNYRTHSYRDVEKLKLRSGRVEDKLDKLRSINRIKGYIILSTCNRYEIYIDNPRHSYEVVEEIRKIYDEIGVSPRIQGSRSLIRHVLRVLLGMESPALFEYEIVDQVVETLKKSSGSSSPILRELFREVIEASIEIREKLGIGGATGFHTLAIDLARRVLDIKDPSRWRVAVVGTGLMARKIIDEIKRVGCGRIDIYSRDIARSRGLAARAGAQYGDIKDLYRSIEEYDVVFVSTRCIDKPVLKIPRKARLSTAVIDISIPKCVEVDGGATNYYWIDSIQKYVEEGIEERIVRGVDEALDRLISRKVDEIDLKLRIKSYIEEVKNLYAETISEIMLKQIAKAHRKFNLTDREGEILDLVVRSIYNKSIGALPKILEGKLTQYFSQYFSRYITKNLDPGESRYEE